MSPQKIKNSTRKFYFLTISGIGFGVAGMCLPPIGSIDWSVLVMIGQLFILAAAMVGLDIKMNLKEGIFESGTDDDEKDEKNSN